MGSEDGILAERKEVGFSVGCTVGRELGGYSGSELGQGISSDGLLD